MTATYATVRQEHAILIPRVSTVKQREEDQTPGLTAYATRKGYIIDGVAPIHGKSAFHGKHVKAVLAAVDEYVKRGTATVVIFRHADRAAREGAFEGYDLVKKIMDAGARVEFSEQEFLNDQPGLLGMFFDLGYKESKIKSDRTNQGHTTRMNAGKLVGKKCWGYDVVNDILVPNTLGLEWIPRIFKAAADGRSGVSIAAELDANRIKPPGTAKMWGQTTIRRMIINPTYKGERTNKGEMEYVPLVDPDLWLQANLAASAKNLRGRGPLTGLRPLLRPLCGDCYDVKRVGCPTGESPMYRKTKPSKNGAITYYACAGSGTRGKTCGAPYITTTELDALVEGFLMQDITPHTTTIYHPAVDSSEAIKEITKRIRKAESDGDDDLVAELATERKGLKLLGTITPAWKEEKPSDMTRAEHYATLDLDARREMLAKLPLLARKRDGITAFGFVMDDGSVNWISRNQATAT